MFYFFFMKDKLSIFEGRQGEVETRVDLFGGFFGFFLCVLKSDIG